MMNEDFVEAYSVSTGAKQTIPRAWLEPGFPPGRDFRKTPLQIVADAAAGERPTEDWTKAQLEQFADDQGIDLGDAKVKADVWAAIDKILVAGDAELVTATSLPRVDEDPYAAQVAHHRAELAAAQQRIADLEARLTDLPQAVADGTASGAAAGQGPTDSDVTPTPDSNTPTSTTETPAAGEEEN